MGKLLRLLRIVGIAVAVGALGLGVFLGNAFLKGTNRWPYATGGADKAFLNATWKMSPQEIERANKTHLGPPEESWWEELNAPSVIDKKRYRELVQADISLWGYSAKVTYQFFDDKLKGYSVGLTVYDPDRPFNEILATLNNKFGPGIADLAITDVISRTVDWDAAGQKVELWITKRDEKDKSYYLGMRSSYKPFTREIEDIVAKEKRHTF